MDTVSTIEQSTAKKALELQLQINSLKSELESEKDALRGIANGKKKEIIVEGVGKVNISAPFEGRETPILTINEDLLSNYPEIRAKLIEKGIAKEDVKKVPATAAKVTIKPNV